MFSLEAVFILGDGAPQPIENININKQGGIGENRCRENMTLSLNPDSVVSKKGFQIGNVNLDYLLFNGPASRKILGFRLSNIGWLNEL